jgi:4-amino-4-deoxy-L-arabinose transferase-like glycosyltransferase
VASIPQREHEQVSGARRQIRLDWITFALIILSALWVRIAAADVVHWYAQRIGKPCLFGDTFIYWELSRTIREGTPFEVSQTGVPHFALRTPGYPAFLAGCQLLFGQRYLPVRIVQAVLGTIGVFVVYRLTKRVLPQTNRGLWSTATIAMLLAAFEPYGVGLGALILSEGPFVPLMLTSLWGTSVLWQQGSDEQIDKRSLYIAIATGLTHGLAILVRPSWALFVPALLLLWIGGVKAGARRDAVRHALTVALTVGLVMMPWWIRNTQIFGRFVPTALWVGASLYDGLSPTATGASDMRFLDRPEIVSLDEETQDAVLKKLSVDFILNNPLRAIKLAIIKAMRFWSPWPNADTLRSPIAGILSSLVTIPIFILTAIGLWDRRGDWRALVLLAGPLIYFMTLHMIFVSSIRYRIPGMIPALGLAAIGLQQVCFRIKHRSVMA